MNRELSHMLGLERGGIVKEGLLYDEEMDGSVRGAGTQESS